MKFLLSDRYLPVFGHQGTTSVSSSSVMWVQEGHLKGLRRMLVGAVAPMPFMKSAKRSSPIHSLVYAVKSSGKFISFLIIVNVCRMAREYLFQWRNTYI